MKVKAMVDFALQFGARIPLNPESILEKAQRYYFLNSYLQKIPKKNFYHAGLYLGKLKKGIFFPSFNLLNMLLDSAVNKIVIDRKSSWLFICGRDIFRAGIIKVMGSRKKGEATMVLNEFGECLGFGRIVNLGQDASKVAVENILDVGDFLRREIKS